jgi:Family of unknown function (DUF6941)
MAKLVLPRVQVMVLCDGIKESDEEYGVYHLSGVRTEIEAASFPFTRLRLCAFLQMSVHAGEGSCYLRVVRAADDEEMYRTAARAVVFTGPLEVLPKVFRFRNCSIPTAGLYYVQVHYDEKLIGERLLQIFAEG